MVGYQGCTETARSYLSFFYYLAPGLLSICFWIVVGYLGAGSSTWGTGAGATGGVSVGFSRRTASLMMVYMLLPLGTPLTTSRTPEVSCCQLGTWLRLPQFLAWCCLSQTSLHSKHIQL